MIITAQQLKEKYSNYADINGKIARDIKQEKLFPLVKGIYETNANTDGYRLAQYIYGPSYLSFDYALARYDLIPEAVYCYTCVSFNKRKSKEYKNKFGTYMYRDIPKDVFHLGVDVHIENDYIYHIATPEKAICDKLYTIKPVKSIKNLKILLFEDLRIDEDDFYKLNKEELMMLAPLYHSTTLNTLVRLLKKNRHI